MRWVSGGQTGVDRALLDAAVAAGVAYGGWCPAAGWAEDMPEPPGLLARYPLLRPTPSADPAQRTIWNVRDSDATLVLHAAEVGSSGTELTIAESRRLGRPLLVTPIVLVALDTPEHSVAAAAQTGGTAGEAIRIQRWLALMLPVGSARIVNVAGPRESESPGAYDASYAVLSALIGRVSAS